MKLKFAVIEQKLMRLDNQIIANRSREVLEAEFKVPAEWAGATLTAIFGSDATADLYEVILNNATCVVPSEVLYGSRCYICLVGDHGSKHYTATICDIQLEQSINDENVETPMEPSLTLYQQLLAKFDEFGMEDISAAITEYLEEHPIEGTKGDKGDPFTYSDFTPEQLNALKVKGDKGDPFTYSDFTPEQLNALKVKGDKGDPGDAATELTEIAAFFDTYPNVDGVYLEDVFDGYMNVDLMSLIESLYDQKPKGTVRVPYSSELMCNIIEFSPRNVAVYIPSKCELVKTDLIEGEITFRKYLTDLIVTVTDGYTPVKGVDYFTEADKTELVQSVINALPTAEGRSF